MQLTGRRVLVVGLGRSGRAAVRLAKARGAIVAASDAAGAEKLSAALRELEPDLDRVETGGHSAELLRWAELIVVSPGVNTEQPMFEEARKRGTEIIGEVELAYRFLACPLIGITGTNGKSTTTALIGHILRAAGKNVFVGGNLGTPLIEVFDEEREPELAVAELSSFQLETIRLLRASVAALLNLAPDHLDRYTGLEKYYAAKMRLFETQLHSDAAVLNAGDGAVMERLYGVRSRLFTFGKIGGNCWIEDRNLRLEGEEFRDVIDISAFSLPGKHNRQNLMAAALVARLAGADAAAIGLATTTFHGLAHRLENLGEIDGVLYINDSKATTIDSVRTALAAMNRPVILILGGRDKGADWTELNLDTLTKTRAIVAYGEAAGLITSKLEQPVVRRVGPFLEALEEAARLARAGDVVLLSPGCASYDQFNDFEERGAAMRKWVQER